MGRRAGVCREEEKEEREGKGGAGRPKGGRQGRGPRIMEPGPAAPEGRRSGGNWRRSRSLTLAAARRLADTRLRPAARVQARPVEHADQPRRPGRQPGGVPHRPDLGAHHRRVRPAGAAGVRGGPQLCGLPRRARVLPRHAAHRGRGRADRARRGGARDGPLLHGDGGERGAGQRDEHGRAQLPGPDAGERDGRRARRFRAERVCESAGSCNGMGS
jgi:hypothetical protein